MNANKIKGFVDATAATILLCGVLMVTGSGLVRMLQSAPGEAPMHHGVVITAHDCHLLAQAKNL